jgi:ParB family chromosome partitioning protein
MTQEAENQTSKKKNSRMALGRGLSALVSSTPIPAPTAKPTPTPTTTVVNPERASNLDSILTASKTPGDTKAPLEASPKPLSTQPETKTSSPTFLPISQIKTNPEQPRQEFSEGEISELSDSIKALGVIQPIIVRSRGGNYEIIAGERRFRAATRAGLQEVPVLIRDISEQEAFEIAMVENIQRQQLNPIEEGAGYQRLMDQFSLTTQEVAERVGKDRATVSNFTRLLRLPTVVQTLLREGKISTGHAKAILTVKEPSAQIGLANKIIAENLTVRAIEAIVSREVVLETKTKRSTGGGKQASSTSQYPDLEERLRNALGTKVTVHKKRKGGQIELHFFSEEELDRLAQILLENGGN